MSIILPCFCWKVLRSISSKSSSCNYKVTASYGCITPKYLSTSQVRLSQKKFEKPGFKKPSTEDSDDAENKKKKETIERITLIGTDDNITISTKENAEKLAKRRNLKLVKIVDYDTKTQRAIYKLMTGAQLFEQEGRTKVKDKSNVNDLKGEKILTLTNKIAENDLNSKLKNVSKWLSKDYHVKVIVNGEEGQQAALERIYKVFQDTIKDEGRVLQKVMKGTMLKFQVMPPKKVKEKTVTEESKGENGNV